MNLLLLYRKDIRTSSTLPHHGLDVGQICAYFHQGLSLNNKQYIQIMCVGEFYDKSAREAVQFFDTIVENART